MYNIKELSQNIYEAISGDTQKKFRDHFNLVVVGNNSTGKTSFVKCILECAIEKNSSVVYYIDPQNRTVFDAENEGGYSTNLDEISAYDILLNRIKSGNFTKKDVFNDQMSGGGIFFTELVQHFIDYEETLEQMMKWELRLDEPKAISDDPLNRAVEINQRKKIIINDSQEIATVSSSEQAKLRIIMELMIAQKKECRLVIIDEFDSHFDSTNMIEFLENIISQFKSLRFIFVIHNFETLVNISDFDAVIFNIMDTSETPYSFVDTNNITQIGDAYRAFNKYVGVNRETEKLLGECISYLIKNEKIPSEIEVAFRQLIREQLTNKEKIMFDYITERYE